MYSIFNPRYATDPVLKERFRDYLYWQWICSLVRPDFNDVHHDLFEYFTGNSEQLTRLNWRELEILIYEVLRNLGFEVELGPGRGDGELT